MSDVAMPRLSDSMEEGTILKWLKSDGDEVSKGDELVEIETDKANMTYEADEAGTLEIVAQEGDTLPVGETICRIGEGGGASDESEASESNDEEPEAPEAEEAGDEEPEASDEDEDDEDESAGEEAEDQGDSGAADEASEDEGEADTGEAGDKRDDKEPEPEEGERIKASPIARRIASEQGIDLSTVEGSGPGGRIVKADVEQSAPEEKAPKEEEAPKKGRAADQGRGETEQVELSRLQRTVARRMAESKATAPDFVMTLEVDMTDAVDLRAQLKAAAGDAPAPSFNDFVIKASALALKDFPRANGAYRDGQFELYSRVNVGVAVAGQNALVVPTVFDADAKSLGQIAEEARKLAERVREGKITPPELSAGTFTISNLGMYGIKRFVAVINPPQAAILAVGELTPRPVVRDGEVVVRTIMELTLSCDHRILYGAEAAEFLGRIREYLEQPLRLVL
ncbi:2-oxo acid dehydrogenase subunit E2 [Solirubrobacter sp. CPCC 204708]|uniref:Dihydrolipoamide acetyltransferase component of pyruvate dehydrogenase complex n=1 Tax=Solirubrobacter deserti TaxID=2282478 RepID=A0ABT4RK71_9ACTN|nr:dihydrolipoamide acetyltransferase family protein [Solirubrobacter deserti]MBE2316831.1 2-oxo acid dehydrogenase subunit E2 [Solirubrobacter deserti]MDA0138952.1 2-oxo acid dehydrogenase subunit E2 [Solirubrobacter deserti]